MNRYVVGFIDFAVNELLLEIVEGIDWKDAIINSSIVSLPEIGICTLEELKVEMWNSDCMINIIEVPISSNETALEDIVIELGERQE